MAAPQRQELDEYEVEFRRQTNAERRRREAMQREVEVRARQREVAKINRRGSFRFIALVLVLIATAALVTVAMFETLFLVMG